MARTGEVDDRAQIDLTSSRAVNKTQRKIRNGSRRDRNRELRKVKGWGSRGEVKKSYFEKELGLEGRKRTGRKKRKM